jgi:hypothetical protein
MHPSMSIFDYPTCLMSRMTQHMSDNIIAPRVISSGYEPDVKLSLAEEVTCSNILFSLGVRPHNQGQWFTPFTIHEVGKYSGVSREVFHRKTCQTTS